MFGLWILILLFAILLFANPVWPYSRGWGYWPSGIVLVLLLAWLLTLWLGWIAVTWPWAVAPA